MCPKSSLNIVSGVSLFLIYVAISSFQAPVSSDKDEAVLSQYKPLSMDESWKYLGQMKSANTESFPDTSYTNNPELLLEIPDPPTSTLTKLITSKESPSFLDTNVKYPTINNSSRNSKILASYKIYIPILVPAVKQRSKPKPNNNIRFIKETKTEMVPVKEVVPHIKEVVKVERVPQTVITDYVRTDGHVPSNIDDTVRPDEDLIGSTVRNYI